MSIPRRFPGEVAIVAGTGPSLTPEVIETCNAARADGKARIFTANRAHEVLDTDVIHACNWEFYDTYGDRLKDKDCDKWTSHPSLKDSRPDWLLWIEGRWEPGLSKDPNYIHYHHGSGPQLVNIAYLYGCHRLILVGWDMRYPGKLDNSNKNYAGPRHFFADPGYPPGEDVLTVTHWSKTDDSGKKFGLIREMETIHPADYGIEIINATPGSAMECFPMADLESCLEL